MSWAAHQFEGYVLQRHFGERYQVSYLAIVAGDAVPDFFAKAWVYGITVNGHRFGASDPAAFHRGWPGAGFTHSLLFGAAVATTVWLFARRHSWAVPWALGIVIGQWAHALTDINDSKGTMLLFPFTTHNFSIGTWAYGAQVDAYHDAAAYYSSLGLVMDVVWLLVVVLLVRGVLTSAYFETVVRPADPAAWQWLSRHLPADAPIVVYRAMFLYGVGRVIAWTTWAHAVEGFAWDLRWGGPAWLARIPPSSQHWPSTVVGVVGVSLALWSLWWFALRGHRRTMVDSQRSTAARASSGQSVTTPSSPVATAAPVRSAS